jgi:hypothetical protein
MQMSASTKRSTGTGVLARDQNIANSGQSWRSTKARCAFVRAKCPTVLVPAVHNIPGFRVTKEAGHKSKVLGSRGSTQRSVVH